MAFDAFLKLDGVAGESLDDKYKDQIEIESFGFSVAQPGGGVGTAGGHAGGRADFGDLQITKLVDAASPNLYQACAKGTVIKEGILTLRRAGGDNPIAYFEVTMNDVMVTSIAPSGTKHDMAAVPGESFTLAYGAIQWKYVKTDPETGQAQGEVATGWDVKKNVPK